MRELRRRRFACAVIDQHFRRFLIGQDPFNIELIWDQMNRSTMPYGLGGITNMAMAGVDLALYDLVARSLGIPASTNCSAGRRKSRSRAMPPSIRITRSFGRTADSSG